MSRKAIEKKIRREYILEKARRLFHDNNIENKNMEDIAIASDYTRRTLYTYFKSRDEILLLLFYEDTKTRWEEQLKAIEEVNTGLEKLLEWSKVLFEFLHKNPLALQLQKYWDYKGIDRSKISDSVFLKFEKLNNELADGLRNIFRIGIKDGSFRKDLNVDMCISQFLYSYRSIITRALSEEYSFAKFNPDEYISYYINLFLNAIKP